MSCDTQISFILVEMSVWENSNLAELNRLSQEAQYIEYRQQRKTSLPGESRRYGICCERIQEIARRFHKESMSLPARPYLGLLLSVRKWMKEAGFNELLKNSPDELKIASFRVSSSFFPPDQVRDYFELLQLIADFPNDKLDALFSQAASALATDQLRISADDCREAFIKRLALAEKAAVQRCAIVDALHNVIKQNEKDLLS